MAVTPRQQMIFWGIGFAAFALALWLLGDTLLPFIVGAALAYFLDPVADRLERLGLGRVAATTVIALGAVLVFVLAIVLAVPALVTQTEEFADALPGYIAQLQDFLARRFPELLNEQSAIRRGLASMETSIREGGLALVNSVLASSVAVLDFLVLLVVTPVVTFYLLLDWDRVVATIDGWLPRQHAETIRRLAREIDTVLAGFVRGQLLVCVILGGFYALALTLIGLPFGFLVGMLAGLVSFIPYVGSITGGVLSIGIALVTFWQTPVWIVVTAAIFAAGQFFEGNILSPKLIGRSVGLHPVWLIFALAVFGKLFGFAGLLVAVPVAAALGVLGRFALQQYLASPLHTGRPPGGQP